MGENNAAAPRSHVIFARRGNFQIFSMSLYITKIWWPIPAVRKSYRKTNLPNAPQQHSPKRSFVSFNENTINVEDGYGGKSCCEHIKKGPCGPDGRGHPPPVLRITCVIGQLRKKSMEETAKTTLLGSSKKQLDGKIALSPLLSPTSPRN